MADSRTNDAPPTASSRDLVLSDEDLAEKAEKLDLHPIPAPSGGPYPTAEELLSRAYHELVAKTVQIEAVRAAIEGRTGSVNVSVILSALGEQE